MNRVEFEQALERWGADLERWPAAAAERAGRYLAADREARRLLRAARVVDGHLVALRQHAAPAYLAGRIAGRLDGSPAMPDRIERLLGWLTVPPWRPAVLGLAVATAGFLAGAVVTEPVDPELADDVVTLAFSDIYWELEDAQP